MTWGITVPVSTFRCRGGLLNSDSRAIVGPSPYGGRVAKESLVSAKKAKNDESAALTSRATAP